MWFGIERKVACGNGEGRDRFGQGPGTENCLGRDRLTALYIFDAVDAEEGGGGGGKIPMAIPGTCQPSMARFASSSKWGQTKVASADSDRNAATTAETRNRPKNI